MSSEGSPHEASQSSQGGGCGSSTGTSRRDHGSGGGAGAIDGSAVKDGNSIKTQIRSRRIIPVEGGADTKIHGVFSS